MRARVNGGAYVTRRAQLVSQESRNLRQTSASFSIPHTYSRYLQVRVDDALVARLDARDRRRDVTLPPSRSAHAPATGSLPRVMAEDAAEAAAQMEEKLKVEDDAAAESGDDAEEGGDAAAAAGAKKKKKKKKKKKAGGGGAPGSGAAGQASPSVPVSVLFNNVFPEGEIQSYKDDNLWRETSEEKRELERLEKNMYNEVRQCAEVHRR